MIKGSSHWEHRTEDVILLYRHGYKEAKYNSKTVSAKAKHATPWANSSSPGYTSKRKEYIIHHTSDKDKCEDVQSSVIHNSQKLENNPNI